MINFVKVTYVYHVLYTQTYNNIDYRYQKNKITYNQQCGTYNVHKCTQHSTDKMHTDLVPYHKNPDKETTDCPTSSFSYILQDIIMCKQDIIMCTG